MILNQFAVNFDCLFNIIAAAPEIFAHSGLDAELTFDQFLP